MDYLDDLAVGGEPETEHIPTRWFAIPAVVVLVAVLVLVFIRTGVQNLPAALVAYLNCVICFAVILRFLRQQSLQGLVPALFLPWLVTGVSVSSLYFATVSPDFYFVTMNGTRRYVMDGNLRFQLGLLLFLAIYVPVVLLLIRKPARRPATVPDVFLVRRLAAFLVVLGGVLLAINAASKFFPMPRPLQYVADEFFLYFNGVFIIAGAVYTLLRRPLKILIILLFVAIGTFYTLGNARGMAVLPVACYVVGILFVSRVAPRKKMLLLGAVCAALPIYLAAANTTRNIMHSIGFTNVSDRLEVMSRWQESVSSGFVLDSTFARLFFSGGHAITSLTPESVPYMDFSLGAYAEEMALQALVPGVIYHTQWYSSTGQLLNYGILITESTSVELSMIGGFWMIGGPLAVAIGGLLVGLFHSAVAWWLARAAGRSYLKGMFYLAMLGTILLWAPNFDLITHFKVTVVHILAAVLLYHAVVRWVVAPPAEAASLPGGLAYGAGPT